MRTFTPFVFQNPLTFGLLDAIADKTTSHESYRNSFLGLGKALGEIVTNIKKIKHQDVLLCCTNEDADWLAAGILDSVSAENDVSLSVMWNYRHTPENDESLSAAPVIKAYSEPMSHCDLLIICKSIIHTSCVVRSNIQYLFEKVQPARTIILAPVMFKGADDKLRNEFPSYMSSTFEFVYFAQDDEAKSGEVIPGIGGSIYERIGLGGSNNKNAYIPDIVKRRRLVRG